MANKNFKARIGIEAPLIAADNGTTAITLTGANVAVAGTLDVQGGTITDSTGALQITTSSNGNLTLAPNGTGKVVSGVTQLADNSMVMGSLLATTNSSYTFPAIPITRVSGNNGLDVASSTIISNGNLGNAAQQQLTHYSGDILAGAGSFAGVVLRTANGNSVTGNTLPFTGAAQTSASGLLSGDVMGAFSFNGYATTDFTDFLGTRNQGGGFIGANSMQIQGLAAENFVNSTLTISGATITAVTRSSPGLSSVTVTGTRGQISFTATTPSVGQAVNVTGTNTGTSTGIVAGVYYIVAAAGTTGATLSATPGGVPITTTAGTTTGLTFSRRWITVTFSAQTYIPFGLQALVAVSGFTGATNGTYMTWGSGSTTTVNIGISTASVALSGTQSISTPTVTNAGSALRIRSIPVATPLNSSNRIDIVDHRPSAAIYRADSFTFNTGAYGNTGVGVTGNNIIYNRVHGQWQYDATLTPAAANTAYAVPFQGVNAVIDFANIASAANTSQIIFGAAGMYKLQFSAQVQNSDVGQDHQITFWWRKNGVDVSNSAGYFTVPKAGAASGALIVGWDNMAQSANATDYYELMYAVSNIAITLPFIAAAAPRPGAASVFLTLVPIGA